MKNLKQIFINTNTKRLEKALDDFIYERLMEHYDEIREMIPYTENLVGQITMAFMESPQYKETREFVKNWNHCFKPNFVVEDITTTENGNFTIQGIKEENDKTMKGEEMSRCLEYTVIYDLVLNCVCDIAL